MAKMALLTVRGKGQSAPSYESAARQIGVAKEDVDHSYGIVLLDPAKSLYAVQVRADRIPPVTADAGTYNGPFADPVIAPFATGRQKVSRQGE